MYQCIGIGSIGAFLGYRTIGIGKKWPILYRYFSNIMLYYLCLQLYQLIIVQSSYLLFNNDEYSIYINYIIM